MRKERGKGKKCVGVGVDVDVVVCSVIEIMQTEKLAGHVCK